MVKAKGQMLFADEDPYHQLDISKVVYLALTRGVLGDRFESTGMPNLDG